MTCDSHRAAAPVAALRAFAWVLALALASAGANAAAQDERNEPAAPAQTTMPALPPAVIDETLAIGGEEIEARKLLSRMTVEVMVNETGPYRFVVDSGADTSVVGERLASELQLPPTTPAMLNSMTDSSMVNRAVVEELKLGPTVFRGLELPVLKEYDIGAAGMIGLDALVEQRLMLDFDERVITVDDAASPTPRFDGEIVVRARLQRGQLILTQVRANGLEVDAVIGPDLQGAVQRLIVRRGLAGRHDQVVE